jgi:hypothetical protein
LNGFVFYLDNNGNFYLSGDGLKVYNIFGTFVKNITNINTNTLLVLYYSENYLYSSYYTSPYIISKYNIATDVSTENIAITDSNSIFTFINNNLYYSSGNNSIIVLSGINPQLPSSLPLPIINIQYTNYIEFSNNTVPGMQYSKRMPILSKMFDYKKGLFADNSRVLYKEHSLSSGGVGTVKNSRMKSKKT